MKLFNRPVIDDAYETKSIIKTKKRIYMFYFIGAIFGLICIILGLIVIIFNI